MHRFYTLVSNGFAAVIVRANDTVAALDKGLPLVAQRRAEVSVRISTADELRASGAADLVRLGVAVEAVALPAPRQH